MAASKYADHKLGLQPTTKADDQLVEVKLTTAAYQYPAKVNNMKGVTGGLDANDRYGDCITPDTRVLTADLQWVSAGSLQNGDRLLAFDEEPSGTVGRRYRTATVECTDVVMRRVYELEFDDGTVVRSSAGHRWLTRSTVQGELGCQRWAETQHLKLGPTRQSRVVKPLHVWTDEQTPETGYLAAAFDGEGNIEQGRGNRLCFAQTSNPMLDRVEHCLKELGIDYTHSVDARSLRLRVDGSSRKDMHRINISKSKHYLRALGVIRPARLLPKFDADQLGRINGDTVRLVRKTLLGDLPVVMLDTSARTYIAEGLASHNCGPTSVDNHRRITTHRLGSDEAAALADVLALYSAATSPPFDPATGANDDGVQMPDLLNAARKVGLGAHRLVGFGKLTETSEATVRAAINLFGAVLFAVDLQTAQQTQMRQRRWDYSQSNDWGGHAICAGAYDEDGVSVFTWGQTVYCTDAFLRHQLSEVWVPLWPEIVQSDVFAAGVDVGQVAQQFHDLTGDSWPAPPLTPVTPNGVVRSFPPESVALLDEWAKGKHRGSTADAAKAWRTGQ